MLANKILVETINGLVDLLNNIPNEKIISTSYEENIDKHTIKFLDKDNDICMISVETQELKNIDNKPTNKKLSIKDRRSKVEELLMVQNLSQVKIAELLNVSQKTISLDIDYLKKIKG